MNTTGYVSTFVAQYHGSGQDDRVGRIVWQTLPIALVAGVANLLLVPLSPALFRWVGHEAAVQAEEVRYFRVLCLGAFPAALGAALTGMLSGLGRTPPVLWVTLLGTILNILFDWLFIFGHLGLPRMGIAGAGWATVLASVLQTIACAALVLRRPYRVRHRMLDWRPDARLLRALVRFGLPNGVQLFVDMAGFTVFLLLIGRLGRDVLAATSLAFNINTLAFMPMIGLGITVSVIVGQALGRNDPAAARAGVRSALELSLVYMVVVAALFVLVPGLFLAPFRAQADPRSFHSIAALASVLLRFVAAYTLFDALNIVFSSALKGAGDTRFVMAMIAVLSVTVLIVPSVLAVGWLHASVYACWTIASVYVAALGVAFYLRYRAGGWAAMRVIEPVVPGL